MTTWLNLIAIAAGGALGSVSRYLLTLAAMAIPGGSSLIGTLLANVLGCAAIGALAQYTSGEEVISERTRLALQIGFLGGLTTFSTFAAESANLAQSGRVTLSGLYVAVSLFLGWAALVAAAAVVKGWMS